MPRVCRTCLKEINSTDFVSIHDSTITTSLNSVVVKHELAICIPELDLNLVINPIVCNPCVNDLHAAYDFKRKCLQTEERIHTYVQSNTLEASCVELSHVIRCGSENIRASNDFPRVANVKLEPDLIEKEYDEDLDDYGNNLPFESNMDCIIKTDPASTFADSNEVSSNSEPFSGQEAYTDFTFPTHEAANLVAEPQTNDSGGKSNAGSSDASKKPSFKCDYGTTENRNLMRHIQSHLEQSTTSVSVTTTKRRTFTIEDKVDIIRMMESGTKMADVCRQTGLATSTVCCIMKKKDVILNAFQKNGLNMKRLRKPRHADVDEALLAWCKEQQSLDVSLSGPILRVKAEELARTIGNYDFVCTNGWLERFRIRYNICVGRRSREAKVEKSEYSSLGNG